jgi:two-component system, OmpR family, sensor histidine kinase SenX3
MLGGSSREPPIEEAGEAGWSDPVAFTVGSAGAAADASSEYARSPDALMAGRLRAALDQVEDGVVICDDAGGTVFRNVTAARLLRVSSDAVLAEQAVVEALLLALQGDYPERILELVAPSPRRLIIRAFPLAGVTHVDGAVAIVQDASDRHRLEAIRRDFVANVSHELKTPVGALSLLAETLDGEDDPLVVDRLAKRVAAEAERLGHIIDDLLDLSRIEANESPRQEMVPLTVIVGQAVELLRSAAASSDVRLEVDDPPKHVAVPGDRRDLVSAVSNLVDNAIKYSERGSLVQVRLKSEAGTVEIAVIDQGVGIPATDKERIFERFYRVDRARSRSTGGTGLGLSIVRHVAVNHSGSVRVDSREGEGSTFTLCLPARSLAARVDSDEKPAVTRSIVEPPAGPATESGADSAAPDGMSTGAEPASDPSSAGGGLGG